MRWAIPLTVISPRFNPRDRNPRDPNEHDFADFLIELTRLERIYGEVFDGPGPERCRSLQPTDFAELSPAEFASCRLRLHECVRLLKLRFPVHEYASSVRQGVEATFPQCQPLHLVITRRDYIVRRSEVTARQFDLLSALDKQIPIGEAIAELCTDPTVDRECICSANCTHGSANGRRRRYLRSYFAGNSSKE